MHRFLQCLRSLVLRLLEDHSILQLHLRLQTPSMQEKNLFKRKQKPRAYLSLTGKKKKKEKQLVKVHLDQENVGAIIYKLITYEIIRKQAHRHI